MRNPERLVALVLVGCGVQGAVYPRTPLDVPAQTEPIAPTKPTTVASAPSVNTAVTPPALVTGPETLMPQLLSGGSAALKSVMADPAKFRFQVLYSPIKNGVLERHGFRVDEEYFFPASEMKVPIAFAMVDRLEIAREAGSTWLGRDLTLRMYPVDGSGDPWVTTLARETQRALIVSDNASANRLLAFVGHREAHESLWSLGLSSARIRTGFQTGVDLDPAEASPKIEVLHDGKTEVLAARKSNLTLPPNDAKGLAIGIAHVQDGQKIDGPMSFANRNAIKIRELQDTMIRIMRPELLTGVPTDMVAKDDLAWLQKTLGTLPSQSGIAGYDRNVVADYQLSPFLRGVERVRPRGHFAIHSKVGQAYGFLVGNAYIVDNDTGQAFFLTAVVYANPNEIMNDDIYAYDAVAFPVLADVAEAACRNAFAP